MKTRTANMAASVAAILLAASGAWAGGLDARAPDLTMPDFTQSQMRLSALSQAARTQTPLREGMERGKSWLGRHAQGVPYTGRHRLIIIPDGVVAKLAGKAYAQQLAESRERGLLDDDPQAAAMVRRVAARLIQAAGDPPARWAENPYLRSIKDLPWEAHLIDTGTVNAFATAGGKIAVFSGLLKITRGDAELATVLAHEVGHVVARHADENLSEAAVLRGLYIGGGAVIHHHHPGNPLADIVGALGGYEATKVALRGFSRVQESEADHLGLILMAKAGYDPLSAVDFWKRMARALPDPAHGRFSKYLRDHPLTATRIANIEKWAPAVREMYYRPQTDPR